MRTLFLILVAGALIGAAGCGGGSGVTPAVGGPTLLDRAIAAAGGREKLAAIKTIDVWLHGDQFGKGYRVHVQSALPDRYRHDLEMGDAVFVQASFGNKFWASVDDYPSKVSADEVRRLQDSWRLVQISTFVPLTVAKDVKVREVDRKGGNDTLEVTFQSDPKGPFNVSLDGTTSLIRSVEWEAQIFGYEKPQLTRFELNDYRSIDGVMVPFRSRIFIADALAAEEQVESVTFNTTIPNDRFIEPVAGTEAPIRERVAGSLMAAILMQEGPEPEAAAAAEERLTRYLAKHGFQRNGPTFRLQPIGNSGVPAVAIPIATPPPETRPTTRPASAATDEPGITTLPSGTVYTTMVNAADPAARAAALEKLLARARTNGVEPSGPCRIVLWSPEIAQLQLPVRRHGE